MSFFGSVFSAQVLSDGGKASNVQIWIGDTASAGFHTNSLDSSGSSASTLTIALCNQGQDVQVKAAFGGATTWGTFDNIKVSAFSGVVVSLL